MEPRWGARNRGGGIRGGKGDRHGPRNDRAFDRSELYQNVDDTEFQVEDECRPLDDLPSRHVNLKEDSINISINNDYATAAVRHVAAHSPVPKGQASFSKDDEPRWNLNWSEPQRNHQNTKMDDSPIAAEPPKELHADKSTAQCKSVEVGPSQSPPTNLTEMLQDNDVPDDESWADEGSWEEATTSGTESQDLSQPSAEPETQTLSEAVNLSKTEVDVFNLSEVDEEMLFAKMELLSPDDGKQPAPIHSADSFSMVAHGESAPISDTRESTPVVEDGPSASPENNKGIQNDMEEMGPTELSEGSDLPDKEASPEGDLVAVPPAPT